MFYFTTVLFQRDNKSLSFNTLSPLGEKHDGSTNNSDEQDNTQYNQKYMPPEPPFTAMASK